MSDARTSVRTAVVMAIPVRRVIAIGAVAGFVPGLVCGCLLGAAISWTAGAAAAWMQQLSFTTGMQVALMPFGNRVGTLQNIRDSWYVVVPVVGMALGVLTAAIGALTAALVAVILPGRVTRPDVVVRFHDPGPSGQP